MVRERINLQLFTEPDLAPEISVDYTSRIASNLRELQEVLGVTEMMAMGAGASIKVYQWDEVELAEQVAAGQKINVTKIKRKLAKTIDLDLDKYRRETTAEDIQKYGRDLAINRSDAQLIKEIQRDVKRTFYGTLEDGLGTATGATLQATLAAAWGEVVKVFEDEDATPVYFISVDDVSEYLGSAQIITQTAFGMTYIENFLGLGTAIVSPRLAKGTVIATSKENLAGAYAPAGSGDVADTFGMTADETGLVGMTHQINSETAVLNTLVFCNVAFFPELLNGVIVATIDETP